MESNLTAGLSYVESTLNGYVKPDAEYGGKNQETYKVLASKKDPKAVAAVP